MQPSTRNGFAALNRPLPNRVPLALVLLLIGLATLVPMGAATPRFNSRIEIPDVVVNLALYFPLGFLLAGQRWSSRRVALFAALLSAAIELLQGTLIAGRRGSLVDVVVNTGGAALGAYGFGEAGRVLARLHRGTLAALLSVPVLGWLGSGVLLSPFPRAMPRYYSLWAHQFAGTEPFHGTLLSVRFQGREVPDGYLAGAPELRADARRTGLRLELRLRSDGPTPGVTHLASIGDLQDGSIIGVDQVESDLMLYWESRGSRLGLRPPRLTLPGAARARRGEQLSIEGRVTGTFARLSVTDSGGTRSWGQSLTPLTGWRSFIPSRELSARDQRLFDLIWTLALLGYLVFCVRLLRPRPLRY